MQSLPQIPGKNSTERRFVLFIGPPKTGSTTLQKFLYKYANQKSNQFAPAFTEWNYPDLVPGQSDSLKYLYDKKTIRAARNFLSSQGNLNVVGGSEYLFENGQHLSEHIFEMLQNWAGIQPEIVIMARNPRTSQLISTWKQQIRANKDLRGVSFRDFLCHPSHTYLMRRKIRTALNPLQVAYEHIYQRKLNTTIIDMRGISQAGFDISHVFSCAVLGVPCTADGGWILGLENVTMHSNSRKGDPNITAGQMAAMDAAFLQRDCAYFADLHNHSLLNVVYEGSGLWPNDCRDISSKYRSDNLALLKEIRRIYQCRSATKILKSTNTSTSSKMTGLPEPSLSGVHLESEMSKSIGARNGVDDRTTHMYQDFTSHYIWMVLGMLMFILILFRRYRGRWT